MKVPFKASTGTTISVRKVMVTTRGTYYRLRENVLTWLCLGSEVLISRQELQYVPNFICFAYGASDRR